MCPEEIVGRKHFYFSLFDEELDKVRLAGLNTCCGGESGIGIKPVRAV
jgi:hypothetical protein